MRVRCKHVEQALAAGTAEDLGADALLQKHLSDCAACSDLQAALSVVDASLTSLPSINPPAALIDELLARTGSDAPTIELVHSGPGRAGREQDTSPPTPGETRAGRALAMVGAFAAAAAVVLVSASSFIASNDAPSGSAPDPLEPTSGTVTLALSSSGASDDIVRGRFGDMGVDGAQDESKNLVIVDGSGPLHGERTKGDKGRDATVIGGVAFLEEPKEESEEELVAHQRSQNGAGFDEGERQENRRRGESARSDEDEWRFGALKQGQARGPARPPRTEETLDVSETPNLPIASGKHQVILKSSPVGGEIDRLRDSRQSLRGHANTDLPQKITAQKKPVEPVVAVDGRAVKEKEVASRRFESTLGAAAGSQNDSASGEKALAWQLPVDQPTFYRYKVRDSDGEGDEYGRQAVAADGKGKLTEDVTRVASENEGLKRETKKPPRNAEATTLPGGTTAGAGLARAFVAERSRHAGVPTVSANGFWSNNYIPGDPRLRLLAGRLSSDPSAQTIGPLDAAVSPYAQSFDAPRSSALAVSVRSDRRAADGPARMLIQVGLKGTARQAGGRPALNIGVVLDLAGSTDETATAMRGLLSALRVAKRRGDRFSLTVANRPGGLLLSSEQFRNGPLRVAMQTLFSDKASKGPTLTLADAVAVATRQVAATDDASGPLGRSMVVVVTASSTSTGNAHALEALAHSNATQGIGLSTIGVGTAVDDRQLLRWAAAGHGNRRLLLRASDAKNVIASELASAEAVVARAVRVRVKLAPGVKLVEVVGAKRLDAAAAARTREAEKSIDRRVAKARGIEADREHDSDGIKVIIPSFSAGDSHVILLDVIADGPGALADVAVTYKDLVHLRNGSARSSLSLRRGRQQSGRVERSVFQNYVGFVISKRLADAGTLLGSGDNAGAERVVSELHDLLHGLRVARSWLRKDAAFGRDLAAVGKFRGVLRGGVTAAASAYVANSLSYAAWRKIVRVRREAN